MDHAANLQCDWLQDWWNDYGVNRTAIDPMFYESYFQNECTWCIENGIGECFHTPCQTVRDLRHLQDTEILNQFMRQHNQWLVMTKIKHQVVLNKPMIV